MYIYERQLQSGEGLGSLFKSLYRVAGPIIKSIGKRTAKRALKSGVRQLSGLAGDVLMGQNVKQSAKQRGRKVGRDVLKTVARRPQKNTKVSRRGGGVVKRAKGAGVKPRRGKCTKRDIFG